MSSNEDLSETENDGFSGSEEDEWIPPANKKSKKNVVSSDNNDDSSEDDDDFVEPVKPKQQKSTKKTISIKPSLTKSNKSKTKPSVANDDDDDDESDSSGDDYLVDPNEIDFNSPFFKSDYKLIEPQIKPPTFDCNVGILSADSDDSDDNDDNENNCDKGDDNVDGLVTKATSSSSSLQKIVQFNENLEKAKKYLANFKSSTSSSGGGGGGDGKPINIKDLLAIGESSETTTSNSSNKKRKKLPKPSAGSSDESEDWEEVDEDDNICIENKNINKDIVINIGPIIKKKSKRQEDAEASIKRKLNRIKKEKQILLHKTHILCWIAYGNYVNPILNDIKLMELCLKFFPKQCYPKDKTDLIFFEQMIKWYKSQISLKSKREYCQLPKLPPLYVSLGLQIKSKAAISKRDYILIFIILLRAIGVQCRMVLNFVTLPLRPPTDELLKISMKKEEDIKKDVKKISNNSTKSKYFNSPSKSEEKPRSSNSDKHAKSDAKKNSAKNSKLPPSSSSSSAIPGPSCSYVKSPEKSKLITTTSAYFSPNKVNISSKSSKESNKISVHNKNNYKNENKSSLQPSTSKSQQPNQSTKSKGPNLSKLKKSSPAIGINKTPPPATDQEKSNAKTVTTNSTPIARRTRAKRETLKFSQLDGGNDESENKKRNSKPKLKKLKEIEITSKTKTKTTTTDEDSDFIEPPTNKKQKISTDTNKKKTAGQSVSSTSSKTSISSSNSINKKNPTKVTPTTSYKQIDRRLLSDEDSPVSTSVTKKELNLMNSWIEVFSEKEEKWLSIDLFKLKVNCIEHIRNHMTKPISYIFGWNNNNTIKDITSRYTLNWNTVTRKLRIEQQWLDETLKPYKESYSKRNFEEDMELTKIHLKEPLPTVVSEYKDHPLYALERHLLKFQGIYPENATPVGYIRKEPVYPRDCVHTLHSREIWVKQARVVKLGQQPYKIVKARPKWDRQSGKMLEPLPLEIFGFWQTQPYEPPTAENGIVPRNAYGNVELFKPEMLPKKTVHLQLNSLNRTCKRMGIDCAQAVVGFEFSGGGSHPVYDGYVICEEFSEKVVAQWVVDQEEAHEKEQEKIKARVYGNWKKLIRGLFIRARLQRKYNFVNENDDDEDDNANDGKGGGGGSSSTISKKMELKVPGTTTVPSTSTGRTKNRKRK